MARQEIKAKFDDADEHIAEHIWYCLCINISYQLILALEQLYEKDLIIIYIL